MLHHRQLPLQISRVPGLLREAYLPVLGGRMHSCEAEVLRDSGEPGLAVHPSQGASVHCDAYHLVSPAVLSAHNFLDLCPQKVAFMSLNHGISCKLVSHTFFWDRRMALPCDDDVPCVYTYFPCCTCCVNGQCSLACCTTINQVTIRNRGGSGGNGQYVNAQTVSPR